MKTGGDHFQTAVRGVDGTWPTAPSWWSYSSLSDAEACPRRWMLSRGDYGGLWEGHGYPPRPALPALVGNVVHHALELLLTALQARGCASVAEPCAVEAIRELGGYSKLVDRLITGELEIVERNPRAVDCMPGLRLQLRKALPHIRERVQMAISRTRLMGSGAGDDVAGATSTAGPALAAGSYTEVELRVDELRLTGRADLITVAPGGCTITDYKTGIPSEHHVEQVQLYALLWSRDQRVNPDCIPIEKLVVSYATHDEVFEPPSDADLDVLAQQIAERIVKAEQELDHRPPPAYPTSELCRFCSVRHLCEDYWATEELGLSVDALSVSPSPVDCQTQIARQNGPRSWVVGLEGEPRSVLLRTPTETPGFTVGDSVRLLGMLVAEHATDHSSEPVLTMTQFSEVFVLGNDG